jgi:hypothetical protein
MRENDRGSESNYDISNWAQVAHAYNPSYSGGRDQEDCG